MAAALERSERKRARYIERKSLGLCTQCGAPAAPGNTRCEKHHKQQRAYSLQKSANRREKGLCADCGDKAEPGKSRCRFCANLHNMNQTARKQQLKQAGLCPRCAKRKPDKGMRYCRKCLARYAAVNRRRHACIREAGVIERTKKQRVLEFRRLFTNHPDRVADRFAMLMKGKPRTKPDTAAD